MSALKLTLPLPQKALLESRLYGDVAHFLCLLLVRKISYTPHLLPIQPLYPIAALTMPGYFPWPCAGTWQPYQ